MVASLKMSSCPRSTQTKKNQGSNGPPEIFSCFVCWWLWKTYPNVQNKQTDLEAAGVIDPWGLVAIRARDLETDG